MNEQKGPSFLDKKVSRRSVVAGLMSLAAAPVLQGCATTPTATSTPTVPTAPAIKINPVTLQWQTSNLTEKQFEPVWTEMITRFQDQNPNIKIEPVLVARADHWTKFVTSAKANQAPDVVSVDVATAAYNGYLRPMDDLWQSEPASYRQHWSDASLSAAVWQKKMYGLPSWGGIYGEFYNKDLVAKAGLDMNKPPATFAEYLEWSKKLTVGGQQWGTAILGGKTDTTTRTLLMWIWANGGDAFNADMSASTFASNPKALEAIQFYLGLDLDHKVVATGAVNTNYAEQTVLFAQEKIATMRNAFWAYAKILGDNPAIKDKVAVAFPPMNGGNQVTMSTMTADSISKDCKDPEAAWKFIKFMNEREWAIKRAKVANWTPLRTDLSNDPEVQSDPLLAKFFEFGKTARTYPLPHPLWAGIAANEIVSAVQASLLKQGTIAENFQKLDADLAKKFKEM